VAVVDPQGAGVEGFDLGIERAHGRSRSHRGMRRGEV
jgi:hypothetical protein